MSLLISDVDRNAEADFAASRITHLSIHTATPGLTGAAEASGGTPAYARKPAYFAAAGLDGPLGSVLQPATIGVSWSDTVTFDIPAGAYTYWGSWSAITGGLYRRGNILSTAQNASSQTQINFSVGIGPYVGG